MSATNPNAAALEIEGIVTRVGKGPALGTMCLALRSDPNVYVIRFHDNPGIDWREAMLTGAGDHVVLEFEDEESFAAGNVSGFHNPMTAPRCHPHRGSPTKLKLV
jgi:hypothetical protein